MYKVEVCRWGTDIVETAKTTREVVTILNRWLVWDEAGGYMRCAPTLVTYKGHLVLSSGEMYDYSHGRVISTLRTLVRRVVAIDSKEDYDGD